MYIYKYIHKRDAHNAQSDIAHKGNLYRLLSGGISHNSTLKRGEYLSQKRRIKHSKEEYISRKRDV